MSNNIAPYYPLHSITTGLYTAGNEFVLYKDFQTEYVGLYHILPNNDKWTGAIPIDTSLKLTEKQIDFSDTVKSYNQIRDINKSKYVSPVTAQPFLTEADYNNGEIRRYFVQKRNNPFQTIREISGNQFAKINFKNKPGINGVMWNSISLIWKLNGSYVEHFNSKSIINAMMSFPGLSSILTDPFEFSR